MGGVLQEEAIMSCVWAFIKLGALKVNPGHHCMHTSAGAGSAVQELERHACPMSEASEAGAGAEQKGVLMCRMSV